MKRLGFIGAGNMGGAILSGLLRKGCLTADQVMVSDKAEGQLSPLCATVSWTNHHHGQPSSGEGKPDDFAGS